VTTTETPMIKKNEVLYINEDDKAVRPKLKHYQTHQDHSGKKSFLTINSGGSNEN
jgi:hypothetical protein